MRKIQYILLGLLCFAYECSKELIAQSPRSYSNIDIAQVGEPLIAETNEEYMQLGAQIRFVTESGEEVIPFGKYRSLETDTLTSYATVILEDEEGYRWVAIDRNENVLFDIYTFDNGPDYVSEGLFRVKRNGKIGFANENGEVVIPCVYECAFPFKDGLAKVGLTCTYQDHNGKGCNHEQPTSSDWFYINRTGAKTE
jgi:hypothetical protein